MQNRPLGGSDSEVWKFGGLGAGSRPLFREDAKGSSVQGKSGDTEQHRGGQRPTEAHTDAREPQIPQIRAD